MNNKVDILVGEVFKKRRMKMGLTQAQMGKLIGMPQSTLACYENGLRGLNLDTFFDLCNAYGLRPNEVQREVKKKLDTSEDDS